MKTKLFRRRGIDNAGWHGEVKGIIDLTANEIALWKHLSRARVELRSPFFSFEFARAVAEAGARTRVCLLYKRRELAGFFPFQFRNAFTQSMSAGERIGGHLNDFCGLIMDPSRHGLITAPELLRCAGLGSLEVSHLEASQSHLGLPINIKSEGARIKLDDDLARYWAHVRSAHRSDYSELRRRERKIERDYRKVEFVFAHPRPIELLKTVIAEKRKQYGRTHRADGLAEPWKLRCLELIARYHDGRCIPVLSGLFVDGQWGALHFGIRAEGVLHHWFPVYQQRLRSFSPGLILLSRMIQEAPNHGINEIDLGEGVSQYKELFATERYPVYRDLWHCGGLQGNAFRAYLSVSWRVRSMLRSLPISHAPRSIAC